jgi:hypothetical protein
MGVAYGDASLRRFALFGGSLARARLHQRCPASLDPPINPAVTGDFDGILVWRVQKLRKFTELKLRKFTEGRP